MTRAVEFEIKASNQTSAVFAEVTAALRGIASETKKGKSATNEAAEAERKRRIELQRTGDAIRASVITPQRQYEQEVRKLNSALRQGAIDQKTHAAAMRKAGVDYKAASGGARGLGGGMLGGVASRIAGPLAATFGAAALTREMRDSFTDLDDLAKRSDRLSVIPAELQKLEYAAGMSGVEVGQLDSALEAYVKRTGNADRITGKTADALKKLGISASQLKGLSLPEEMRLLADGLAGVADGEERLNLSMALFGSSGAEMLNVLGQGSAELDKMFRERESLGGLFSRGDLAGVEAANDAFERATLALSVSMQEAAIALAPVVEDLSNSLTEWVKNAKDPAQPNTRDELEAMKKERDRLQRDGSRFGEDLPFAKAGQIAGLNTKIDAAEKEISANERHGLVSSGQVTREQLDYLEKEYGGVPDAHLHRLIQAEFGIVTEQRQRELYGPKAGPDPNDPRNAAVRPPRPQSASTFGRLSGMLGRAGSDGASLLERGVQGLDALGPLAGNAVRNARGDLEAAAARAEENVKAGREARRAADSLRRSNMTPDEIFAEAKKKADELLAKGEIDQATHGRELSRLEKQRRGSKGDVRGVSEDRRLRDVFSEKLERRPVGLEVLQTLQSRTLTRGDGPLERTEKHAAKQAANTDKLVKSAQDQLKATERLLRKFEDKPTLVGVK